MTDWLAQGYRAMQPGVFHRVSCYGAQLMLCEVALEAGAAVPPHAHPHEQISYIVSGKVTFDIAGQTVTLTAGGSCLMPPDAPHSVHCLEDALVLDVFTPLREDFLR